MKIPLTLSIALFSQIILATENTTLAQYSEKFGGIWKLEQSRGSETDVSANCSRLMNVDVSENRKKLIILRAQDLNDPALYDPRDLTLRSYSKLVYPFKNTTEEYDDFGSPAFSVITSNATSYEFLNEWQGDQSGFTMRSVMGVKLKGLDHDKLILFSRRGVRDLVLSLFMPNRTVNCLYSRLNSNSK